LDQGPAPATAGLDSQTHIWTIADLATFELIGFAPDGPTRYQYAVGGSGVTTFVATATGNLDDDATPCVFTVDKSVATYPKAIKSGDDF
jgi:hypothetical protein